MMRTGNALAAKKTISMDAALALIRDGDQVALGFVAATSPLGLPPRWLV